MKFTAKKILLVCLIFVLSLLAAACGAQRNAPTPAPTAEKPAAKTEAKAKEPAKAAASGQLVIKMLDVGQGDAILVRGNGKTILIDTSDIDEQDKLKARLKEEKVTAIDALILTHPHADHMGGVDYVLKNIPVAMAYDNGQQANQKFYLNYLKTLKEKKIKSKTLTDGDVIDFGGGLKFAVVSPTKAMRQDGGKDANGKINLNLNSVVGRLTYGEFAMMFTGDAETPSEANILKNHKADELASQILKSGHHASKTASSDAFLKAVNPEIAVISCGIGNAYHHPHPSVRNKYLKRKIDFYRTDVNGTITITTTGAKQNGKLYQIKVQKGKKNDETGN